jgi:hypothetical protein
MHNDHPPIEDSKAATVLNLRLCPSCQHAKHVGEVCGVEVGSHPNNEGLMEPTRCACNDAKARKADSGKTGGFGLIPYDVIKGLAAIYDYGRKKYAANSWQTVPPDEHGRSAEERYEDAMWRHYIDWKGGEFFDPESKLPHLWHFLWGAVALCWFNDPKRKPVCAAKQLPAQVVTMLSSQSRVSESIPSTER